jgi:hypothetical protein
MCVLGLHFCGFIIFFVPFPQPEARESNGGQKLVRKADFHIGQHVNHMFRIRAKITDPSSGRLLTGTSYILYDKVGENIYSSLDTGNLHLKENVNKFGILLA